MPGELFANNAQTTLSAAVSSTTATSITVASSVLFPPAVTGASQFRVLVGQEIMLVTNVSGTTWTVTRGAEGTVPSTHSSGATVTHIVTAGALDNGSMRLIQSTTLTAQATSVSFPSIPSNYRVLYLWWDTGAALYSSVMPGVRFNGVTAAGSHIVHYQWSTSGSMGTSTQSYLDFASRSSRLSGFYWIDAATTGCHGIVQPGTGIAAMIHGGLATPARVASIEIISGAFPVGAKFELYGM